MDRTEDTGEPLYDTPEYRSTELRAPKHLYLLPEELHDPTGPVFGESDVGPVDNDLTSQHEGEPLGERIVVTGRVLDSGGRPIPHTLVEVWQANAAGRYAHDVDRHPAPLDPNFLGIGRCHTNENGEYRFLTVMPGAYPWRNHPNAWRPAHIHFSLFGNSWASRLVTQMYFAGDPLLPLDPIFNSAPTERARAAMIASYAHDVTEPEWALGWRWDIVLDGPDATAFEPPRLESAGSDTPVSDPLARDPLARTEARDLHL